METTPDLQVYDLGHLGLAASIVDRIGLVPLVDEQARAILPAGVKGVRNVCFYRLFSRSRKSSRTSRARSLGTTRTSSPTLATTSPETPRVATTPRSA